MWGDASSAVADVGFYPQNLQWKLVIQGGGGPIKQLPPGGSCTATIVNSNNSVCLQGGVLAHLDAAADGSSLWHIKRSPSSSLVADLANGSFVHVVQQSGAFSEVCDQFGCKGARDACFESWVRTCHLQPLRPSAPLLPSSPDPFIIGICGPSGCGKSALAHNIKTWAHSRLSPAITCCVLSMDRYFDAFLCSKLGHWENPESIRVARFMASLEEEKAKSYERHQQHGTRTVIVLEGFLLFFFPQAASACHHRIQLECPEHVACSRRLQRQTKQTKGLDDMTPAASADMAAKFSKWYHDTVWKHFIKFSNVQRSNVEQAGGCQKLNAEEPEEHLVAQSVEAIARVMPALFASEC